MNIVKLPYEGQNFNDAWDEYNKFLLETFQIELTYIQKVQVFSMLDIESEGNVNKAIAMLKWNIRNENNVLDFPAGVYDKDTIEYL